MSQDNYLKCTCDNCGGKIEYPADGIGSTIPCPHCGWETELTIEPPADLVAEKSPTSKWIVAGAVILGLGILAVVAAMILTPRLVKKARQNPNAVMTQTPLTVPEKQIINNFSVSAIFMEKTPASTLVYATGTLKNEAEKQRFDVTVELDLMDAHGVRIGIAKDYAALIEPQAEWKFRALVVQKNVSMIRVSGIKEQP